VPKAAAKPLTVRQVETLTTGVYCDGGGLYLHVRPNARSWIFRYTPRGGRKPRHMGLGSAKLVTLAQARRRASELLYQVKVDRVDPLVDRRAVQAEQVQAREQERPTAPSFEACAKAFLAERLKGRHQRASTSQFEIYVYPTIGAKRVNAITREHVLQVLRPIWTTMPPTADIVQKLLSRAFRYAVYLGYRTDDPAQWKDALDNVLPSIKTLHSVKHQKGLDVEAMPAFMARLRACDGNYYRATEFTILTAARREMTRDATWSEIDMTGRVWTIPAERMKSKREFRIPLSDRAFALVELMAETRRNDYVFPGDTADRVHTNAQLDIMKEVSGDRTLTIHGQRGAFRSWVRDKMKGVFDRDTVETAMAHKIHVGAEAAYIMGDILDERRKLMQAWDDYCSR
jgi:integrase